MSDFTQKPTKEYLEQLYRYNTAKEIATLYNVQEITVKKWLSTHDIKKERIYIEETRPKESEKAVRKKALKELCLELLQRGKPISEIGIICHASQSTIYRWIKEAELNKTKD